MKRLKVLFVAFAALCALASVLAGSASASVGPTLLFPAGGGPTVLLNITPRSAIESELQSAAAKIHGKKLSLEITLLEEKGHLEGIYLSKFFETEKTGTGTCTTSGAAEAAEIEVGEKGKSEKIKVVYITTSPLAVGELFEVTDLTIICNGTLEILVKGNVLGTIEPLNKKIASGSNTIEGGLHCLATPVGEPAITKYINSEGKAATASLTAEAGGTKSKACELIGTTSTTLVKLLPNKEIELMG